MTTHCTGRGLLKLVSEFVASTVFARRIRSLGKLTEDAILKSELEIVPYDPQWPSGFATHSAPWPCASTITARRRFRASPQKLSSTSRYQSLYFSRLRRTARLCRPSDTFTFQTLTTHSVHSSIGPLSGLTRIMFTR